MNSSALTLATSSNGALFTDIDLLVLGLATLLWIWGIVEARKRRVSRGLQLIFTLIMFGGTCGDILIQQIVSDRPNLAFSISSLLWLAALAVGGFWLIPKKRAITYPFFVVGISLVYLSFFVARTAGLLSYALLVLGFLFVVCSVLLARS